METKQTKEEKATIDIVKEMQKTVNSLGSTIGELKTKVDAMPTDYVKSDEIGKVMTEYFKEARIYSSTVTAKIPESLTETINGLKKSFWEAKKGIDESIAGIKPKQSLPLSSTLIYTSPRYSTARMRIHWWITAILAMTSTGLHTSPPTAASGSPTQTRLSSRLMPRRP